MHVTRSKIVFDGGPMPYSKDIDILGIYLNNITNQLICQDGKNIQIICKWGHPWFFINKNNKIATSIFFTEAKLC